MNSLTILAVVALAACASASAYHGAVLAYAAPHSYWGDHGPSGVVTGAGASGPSGVVTGAGAAGPSGVVNGHGAVGPTGPNGHGVAVVAAAPVAWAAPALGWGAGHGGWGGGAWGLGGWGHGGWH